ncbi:hypothetical protein [Bifidobacterium leontopitheci]|uniref:Uncharacterized protein n=1 Tax=Bifidobacterium leontopitheci TaxID=2650774 RepID=A0A6I1GFZ4_9BIFI|nr:hypothetical protein [Bifidobacterium leontopitheci]KAB7790563.1 hypothetical protein F7D09_0932 [Bifidobacterium leontopitheci]
MNAIPAVETTMEQVTAARQLPRRATENVVAAVLGLPLSTLRTWRRMGHGPDHESRPDGTPVYERRCVIAWCRRHLKETTLQDAATADSPAVLTRETPGGEWPQGTRHLYANKYTAAYNAGLAKALAKAATERRG